MFWQICWGSWGETSTAQQTTAIWRGTWGLDSFCGALTPLPHAIPSQPRHIARVVTNTQHPAVSSQPGLLARVVSNPQYPAVSPQPGRLTLRRVPVCPMSFVAGWRWRHITWQWTRVGLLAEVNNRQFGASLQDRSTTRFRWSSATQHGKDNVQNILALPWPETGLLYRHAHRKKIERNVFIMNWWRIWCA